MFAESGFAKIQIKIVTDDEDVFWCDFVEVGESLDGFAYFVVIGLRFDKDCLLR